MNLDTVRSSLRAGIFTEEVVQSANSHMKTLTSLDQKVELAGLLQLANARKAQELQSQNDRLNVQINELNAKVIAEGDKNKQHIEILGQFEQTIAQLEGIRDTCQQQIRSLDAANKALVLQLDLQKREEAIQKIRKLYNEMIAFYVYQRKDSITYNRIFAITIIGLPLAFALKDDVENLNRSLWKLRSSLNYFNYYLEQNYTPENAFETARKRYDLQGDYNFIVPDWYKERK